MKDSPRKATLIVTKTSTDPQPTDPPEVREEEGPLGRQEQQLATRAADFVKVEKNIISLGFFSPSSSRSANAKPKVMSFTRMEGGQRFRESVTITPGYIEDDHGKPKSVLPNTADQDKYLAFHKLLMERRRKHGTISNPVEFTSAELLRLLGVNHSSGKNLKEVAEWLDVMSSATVMSKLVWHASSKRWAKGKDRYHVFARAVSVGEQYEPGKVAETNLVWLDPWQMENLIQNFTLPIDFETYRRLNNHIAKALVPILQVWLYATREKGSFEKRYDELCQFFSLTPYVALSRITQQLKRSLDELQGHGYLSRWSIEPAGEPRSYKVVFWHGEKFHRDRGRFSQTSTVVSPALLEAGTEEPRPATETVDAPKEASTQAREQVILLGELIKRGIAEKKALQLLSRLPTGQEVLDVLEWGDHLIAESRQGRGQPFRNPPGFYIHLVSNNINPPDAFMTTRQRRLHQQAREAQAREEAERERQREAYHQYKRRAVRKHLEETYPGDAYEKLIDKEIAEILRYDPKRMEDWKPATQRIYAESRVRSRIEQDLPCLSFEEFVSELEHAPLLPFVEGQTQE